MPSKKQRKRTEKERRHEYETVWVDSEGNELDEVPADAPAPRARRTDAKKPQRSQRQRPARTLNPRIPQPPSWRRSAKRAGIMAAVVTIFMYLLNSKVSAGSRLYGAVLLGGFYALLFTPFTYYLDRFGYNRYQRKTGKQPTKR
jgi:hypothetical protein